MLFQQSFRNIRRVREILRVFFKYGFEELVTSTQLGNLIPQSRRLNWLRQDRPVMEYTRWERIRMIAEELGPTFIKGAQVLSNRPDILPEELITEFKKLQSNVKTFPFEEAKIILEKELGKPLTAVFESFNEVPIGSASIGQVYRAKLRTGEEVVVKVQRPGVEERIRTDLDILKDLARRAQGYLERSGVMDPMDIIKSFERTMLKELKYIFEAQNIDKFRTYYKNDKTFYVPKAYLEYTTDRILVLEFIRGCKITDVETLTAWGLKPHDLAERGLSIYLNQIFEHGYFHADPHPGNIIIRRDGVICLIDFGMVGSMIPRERRAFAQVFVDMAQRDAEGMARHLLSLSSDDDITDMNQLMMDLHEMVEDYGNLDVSNSSMAEMSMRFQRIVYDYRLKIPGSVFLIFRALAILEGIGKEIHPTLNTFDFVRPFGIKIATEQFRPENLAKEAYRRGSEVNALLASLPDEIREILKKVRKGRLTLIQHNPEYHLFIDRVSYAANRVSNSLVIASLVIGSSLLPMAEMNVPQTLAQRGLPTLSIIGYVLAGLLMIIQWFTRK